MKKLLFLSFFLSLLCVMEIAEARGGRGGGGGRNVQRSPSMSRADRPSGSQAKSYSASNIQQRGNAANKASPATRATAANRAAASKPSAANRASPATRSTVDNRVSASNMAQMQRINRNTQNSIRNRYPNRGNWFKGEFWDNHNYYPPYYGYNQNWWAGATAMGLASWLTLQSDPYYYGFDDFDYWEPSPVYDAFLSSSSEWMPLGVFSISKNKDSLATPNLFLQLAINKAGGISGTLFNATNNKTQAITGSVDPESQRAVWKIANEEASPIMETGIYNLTQPEVPVRIYFPNGRKQDWLLVQVAYA